MEKIQYGILLIILIIPISVTNVYAQTLQVDASISDMKDIEDSKYKATAISVVRNSNGELISVVRIDASRHIDDPIVDEFLNSDPKYLVKQGTVNEEKINMYNIIAEYSFPECISELFEVPGYSNSCNWYHRSFVTMLGVTDEDNGSDHTIFKGLNHAFTLRQLDEVTTFWTILTKD